MVNRGQVWTLLQGSNQYRVLIISNDEYNYVEDLPVCALAIQRETPPAGHLTVDLQGGDPYAGAKIRIHSFVKINDRTALKESHGFISPDTMAAVERAVRDFLELP